MWLKYKRTTDAPVDLEWKVLETLGTSAYDRLVQTHCRINNKRMDHLTCNRHVLQVTACCQQAALTLTCDELPDYTLPYATCAGFQSAKSNVVSVKCRKVTAVSSANHAEWLVQSLMLSNGTLSVTFCFITDRIFFCPSKRWMLASNTLCIIFMQCTNECDGALRPSKAECLWVNVENRMLFADMYWLLMRNDCNGLSWCALA